MKKSITIQKIGARIYEHRGLKVMIDSDLAKLYGVSTKNINKAVKRNKTRFPRDFMFQLSKAEAERSRFQFGTLKRGQNIKFLPYVFTQEGIAMLSSVLRSKQAVEVNIHIMRAFVRLRTLAFSTHVLARKILDLEASFDDKFKIVFQAIQELINVPKRRPKLIGFLANRPKK